MKDQCPGTIHLYGTMTSVRAQMELQRRVFMVERRCGELERMLISKERRERKIYQWQAWSKSRALPKYRHTTGGDTRKILIQRTPGGIKGHLHFVSSNNNCSVPVLKPTTWYISPSASRWYVDRLQGRRCTFRPAMSNDVTTNRNKKFVLDQWTFRAADNYFFMNGTSCANIMSRAHDLYHDGGSKETPMNIKGIYCSTTYHPTTQVL